jgi:hypothetical protein
MSGQLTKEQAWMNIYSVVRQFRGLTIEEAEAVKQSLILIGEIVNPKKEEDDNG